MINMTRRSFFQQLAALAGSSMIVPREAGKPVALARVLQAVGSSDEDTCLRRFTLAVDHGLAEKPMGEIMVAVGMSFLGSPYRSNTLEVPGKERLVVNLQMFDCVTFVESTLALSRCIKRNNHTFDDFKRQLQFVRYRSGTIDGYPSRLHYFTDWVGDNQAKRVVKDVTRDIGGEPYRKAMNFMSTHKSLYRQLSEGANAEKIKAAETKISAREQYHIPKGRVAELQSNIRGGDIIALTTSIEGLDVSHAGLAIDSHGTVKYLHAPLTSGSVQLSEHSLADYLTAHEKQTGIIVARPLEPT